MFDLEIPQEVRSEGRSMIPQPTWQNVADGMVGDLVIVGSKIYRINERDGMRGLDQTEMKAPKRNEPCLCGSGNKFKKCCLK